MCSSKNIHTPTEGTFVLTPPPWNFHFKGCLSYSPSPWNFCHFLIWLDTPWEEFVPQKCCCTIPLCDSCFCGKEKKKLFIYVNTVSKISLLPCSGLFYFFINSKSLKSVEAVQSFMSQVISSLKQGNFSYFLSVENMLEEGLLEPNHIALNATMCCVTRQQVEKWNFIHDPTTIFLHRPLCKAWKMHSADRE